MTSSGINKLLLDTVMSTSRVARDSTRVRNAAIVDAHTAGHGIDNLARASGLSPARIEQIVAAAADGSLPSTPTDQWAQER